MISPKSLLLAAVAATALALPSTAAAVPTPGAPTITSKPKSLVNRTTNNRVAWTAGSGATVDHYECRIVLNGSSTASGWESCSSNDAFYSAVDTTTTVLVRGVSATGLKGAFSQATWKVRNMTITSIGDITFTGSTVAPGTVLKAGALTVQNSSGNGSVAYAWRQCRNNDKWDCQLIDGAVGPYYRVTKDDVGFRINVIESYTSDTTDDSDTASWGTRNTISELTPLVVADVSAQPSLSWSGALAFGKAISYSIGSFKGGFTPCDPGYTCAAEKQVTLEYCSTTSADSCVESYSMRNVGAAFSANVFPNARGVFRLVEGMAVGYHIRLHVRLSYSNGVDYSDFYSPISTATVAGPETTANPTISGTAKVGSQMNSTLGTWINSYIYTGSSLYDFYYARPYVDWYRCTSATDTSTCSPAHRYETAHWWDMVGAWSGWRAYTGYRPTSGDVGYYMRTKATMDLWWPLSSIHSGDMDSYESGFGAASAKVVS